MRALFDWLDRVGHHVDISALRRRFPDVRWHRFEQWAATQDWPSRERPDEDSAVDREARS
jgi:hypothetical protein